MIFSFFKYMAALVLGKWGLIYTPTKQLHARWCQVLETEGNRTGILQGIGLTEVGVNWAKFRAYSMTICKILAENL